MIYCPKCGMENDDDSLFCKKCGFPLDEDPKNYNEPSNKKNKDKKVKTKTKTKNKHHSKTKTKYRNNNEKQKGKMSFFQSFMMFFFILLSICALGVAAFLGYYIYQNSNIEVPDVTGYTYENAERTLKDSKLQAQMVEETVTDEDKVGIVIKQNKKSGSKVMENTVIKLTVGVLDTKVTVPNVEGLSLDEATTLLNENNIKYEIKYETSDKENNIVLDQSVKANKKIENTEIVIITVSKKEELKLPNPDENNQEGNSNNTQTDDQTTNQQDTQN